jgi:hypothetical protein
MIADFLAGVRGVARRHSTQGNTGDPTRRGGKPRSTFGVEPRGKSEGLIVLAGPRGQHNREGRKEPWFEACLDERRIRRLA